MKIKIENLYFYGLSIELFQQIEYFANKYQIKKVILFGSRARGDFYKTSDIDLAIIGGDFDNFSLDVDELTDTLLKYDFVNLDKPIQQELKEAIEQEGVILYEKV